MILYLSFAASLAILARTSLPGNYSPAHLWAYTWAFAWACQAVFGAGYLIATPIALFVGACNIAFLIGAFVASGAGSRALLRERPSNVQARLRAGSKLRTQATLVGVVAGIVSLELGLRQIGHPGLRFLVTASLVNVAEALVTTKSSFNVNGVWVRPVGISLATLLLLCGAVLAGIEASIVRRKARRNAAAALASVALLATLLSLSTGVRSYLVLATCMYLGSYLTARVAASGPNLRVPGTVYIAGLVVVGMLLVWTVVVQSARRGDLTFAGISDTLDYLRAWFAGYIPALSQWLSTEPAVGTGLGTNLGRGVIGPLGMSQGEGVSSPLAAVAIGNGASSNAMTVFRVLIADFGYAGSIVACAVGGFLAERIWHRVSLGSVGWIAPLAAIYAAVLYSFNYWFFAYGSRIAAVALAGVTVWIADVRSRDTNIRPGTRLPTNDANHLDRAAGGLLEAPPSIPSPNSREAPL